MTETQCFRDAFRHQLHELSEQPNTMFCNIVQIHGKNECVSPPRDNTKFLSKIFLFKSTNGIIRLKHRFMSSKTKHQICHLNDQSNQLVL